MTKPTLIQLVGTRLARLGMGMCGIAALSATVACHPDPTGPGFQIPADPFASIQLNVHAVTLSTVAPLNTIQITPVFKASSGKTITGLTPSFRVSDSTLMVSTTGLVTALDTTRGSYVDIVVRDPSADLTRSERVYINVTSANSPPALTEFSIHTPGDSTGFLYSTDFRRIAVVAQDADGNSLSDALPVSYVSSIPSAVPVGADGSFSFLAANQTVTITASTTYYGVTKTDSVRLYVGYPNFATIEIDPGEGQGSNTPRRFSPDTVWIGPGAIVLFSPSFAVAVDVAGFPDNVIFDDSTVAEDVPGFFGATGSGNISVMQVPKGGPDRAGWATCGLPDGAHCFDYRKFTRVGTHPFHSSISGATGAIIVMPLQHP